MRAFTSSEPLRHLSPGLRAGAFSLRIPDSGGNSAQEQRNSRRVDNSFTPNSGLGIAILVVAWFIYSKVRAHACREVRAPSVTNGTT
jgi:hypothetical protein